QGKTHALNTGIAQASGELLLFTDDDVDVAPEWLKAYAEAARMHREAVFFGGKIVPAWETEPPAWLLENAELLSGLTGYYDRAALPPLVESHAKPFYGANLALRKSALSIPGKNGVVFRTDF